MTEKAPAHHEEIPFYTKRMMTQWVTMAWFEGHMDALDGPQATLVPIMEKWLDSGARNELVQKEVIDEMTEAQVITMIFKNTPPNIVNEAFEFVARRALKGIGINADVILGPKENADD